MNEPRPAKKTPSTYPPPRPSTPPQPPLPNRPAYCPLEPFPRSHALRVNALPDALRLSHLSSPPPFRENLHNSRPVFRADCNGYLGRPPMTKTAITHRATKPGKQPNLLPSPAVIRANIRVHISVPNQILVSQSFSRSSPYGISTPPPPKNSFK